SIAAAKPHTLGSIYINRRNHSGWQSILFSQRAEGRSVTNAQSVLGRKVKITSSIRRNALKRYATRTDARFLLQRHESASFQASCARGERASPKSSVLRLE